MNGGARPFAALRLFCIARFLARFLPSDLSRLRSSLHPSLSACHQTFSRLPPPLAYRERREGRGETVRKRPQILPILQPGYFFAQGMCLYIFVGSFSVGLRPAKTTEIRAKVLHCAVPR